MKPGIYWNSEFNNKVTLFPHPETGELSGMWVASGHQYVRDNYADIYGEHLTPIEEMQALDNYKQGEFLKLADHPNSLFIITDLYEDSHVPNLFTAGLTILCLKGVKGTHWAANAKYGVSRRHIKDFLRVEVLIDSSNISLVEDLPKCKQCGTRFKKNHKKQLYCSDGCRMQYWKDRAKEKSKSKTPLAEMSATIDCLNCGKTVKRTNHHHKYCSVSCREQHYRKKALQQSPK